MKLYRISQEAHNGYDTYSDAVVAAPSTEDAKAIRPDGRELVESGTSRYHYNDWADNSSEVEVEFLGHAKGGTKRGVICASFHAG